MTYKLDSNEEEPKKKTIYTLELSVHEMDALRQWCTEKRWSFYEVDHARFAFKGDRVNLVAYKSGKVVIQGKKTEDFVRYVIESEITKTPLLGYDEFLNPEWFEAHAGLDESGKGDLFGPLVSACVIADGEMVKSWRNAGIQDSKRITSDQAILKLDQVIRKTKGVVVQPMCLEMRKYNELYERFGSNLNRLLAWMHAKSLEEALKKRPVEWGMLDQFSKQPLVQRYLTMGSFHLKMETKAERDPVVAAASIVARAEYLKQIQQLSDRLGEKLLKGANAAVKEQGKRIVEKYGREALGDFAKLHFRTSFEILGLPVPEKREWKRE